MRKIISTIIMTCLLFFTFSSLEVKAQNDTLAQNGVAGDTAILEPISAGKKAEDSWRNVGASYTVAGVELERMTSGNLLNTLNGRLPGLTVFSGSGEPGYDNPNFLIRGISSWNLDRNNMIVLLDGFEVDLSSIASLSASEVESVSILKDASSLAVYGLQGGGGALVVTTKRGFVKSKPLITFNARYGSQSAIDLPTPLDAYDYTRLYNQARLNDGLPAKYANPELYKSKNDPIHPNVNWYDEVLKSSSAVQNYNLSFRGGSDKARYFLILDHANISGLYKNADELDKDFGTNAIYKKYNLRGNVDLQLSRNLSVKAEISGKIEDRDTPAGFDANGLFDGLMNTPAAAFPVKNPDGTWATSAVYGFNPIHRLKTAGIYNGHTRSLQTNFSFNEKLDVILSGLSLNGGLSLSNQYVGFYSKTFQVPTWELSKDAQDNPVLNDDDEYVYIKHGDVSSGIGDGEASHWTRFSYQFGLNYDKSFGEHTITSMVLARRQNYSHNGLVYELRTQGISGNATYDYAKKYIASLTLGYTGSSDFADGKRYGLFPAFGAAWVMSNESFLKNNSIVNFLKIKASYGLTGNINESYRFLDKQWGVSNVAGWRVNDDNAVRGGWAEGPFGNSNFSWEEKASFNIGFESSLMKNFSVAFDYFNEKRTGIISSIYSEVPAYTGFNLPLANNGKVKNHGFEALVRYDANISGDFHFYVGATAAFARNEIEYIAEDVKPENYLLATGYRVAQARGLQTDGFYQVSDFDASGNLNSGVVKSSYSNVKPGDIKYKDKHIDGIINSYDYIPMEYSEIPEWNMGINLGFNFKGFDFDAFVQAVTNRTVMLPEAYRVPFIDDNNITVYSLNSWTPETASTATTPRLSTQLNLNNRLSNDLNLIDGSFIKLRSIELGYTFPKIGFVNSLRVYANGTNLFTWDKIDDLEAENLSMYYPLMKSVSLGLKLQF